MTDEQLDALERLAAAASPGEMCRTGHKWNDEFILADRRAVPELIAEVRRLRARLEWLEWPDRMCRNCGATSPFGRYEDRDPDAK